MIYWLTWTRTVRNCTYRAAVRVIVERGIVQDAGEGLQRFINDRWDAMWKELERAGWRLE